MTSGEWDAVIPGDRAVVCQEKHGDSFGQVSNLRGSGGRLRVLGKKNQTGGGLIFKCAFAFDFPKSKAPDIAGDNSNV
jgi:hypothetical protein